MVLPADFTFAPKVKDVKSLPPEAQPLYNKAEDGEYALDPVMAKHLDTSGLNGALEKERKTRKDLEAKVAAWKELGDDAATIKKKLDDAVAAGDLKNADVKVVREKLKAEFDATLAKTVGEKDEALTKMQRSMHRHLVEKEAVAALAKHKGSTDLLLPHVVGKLMLVEEDGDFVVRIKDKDGEAMGDGRGGFKTVDAYVAEMRADEKYARAFDATGKGGTGAKPTNGGKGGGQGDSPVSSVSKISMGLRNRR